MSGSVKRRRTTAGRGLMHAVIALVLGLELVPLYMMLQISFKSNDMFAANPWLPPFEGPWLWRNYLEAAEAVLPYVANSVFVSVLTVFGGMAFALFGAYFFARFEMPFKRTLFLVFLALMAMPSVANLVPLFNLLKGMGLMNTLWAIIIVGVAGAQAFNIFVLRNFIEDLPRELFEAAEMDGASHFQQAVRIVLPLCGSIMGTLSILLFIREWNEYLLPIIILRDKELFTLGVGLIYLDGERVKQWGEIMAAYTLASLPLIVTFAFSMRLFVKGFAMGAVKG